MPVVTHQGNAPLNDQWTLTVIPDGAEVRFANAAEDEPPLVLTDLGGVSELVVSGRDRTVLADGVPTPALVKPGSGWPMILPGAQTITVDGSTNWSLSFPTLYL